MTTLAALGAGLLIGALNGWNWGWNRGKLIGDREHEACHRKQTASIMALVKEEQDMASWEEEL